MNDYSTWTRNIGTKIHPLCCYKDSHKFLTTCPIVRWRLVPLLLKLGWLCLIARQIECDGSDVLELPTIEESFAVSYLESSSNTYCYIVKNLKQSNLREIKALSRQPWLSFQLAARTNMPALEVHYLKWLDPPTSV